MIQTVFCVQRINLIDSGIVVLYHIKEFDLSSNDVVACENIAFSAMETIRNVVVFNKVNAVLVLINQLLQFLLPLDFKIFVFRGCRKLL